ncbi:cell death regulator Aven [Seriola dumerili]|uniref:cell death regulator Aven n=1 Tax=Seriola dumerili TaxID=41447 RepID=UPI000BBEDC38|nr:cell death regulator Aven [Seriola dumerili]XP_022593697.1 cell death regulator Aven [Seriola dumerili]XP_022593698.1 cell death regulator Aven [Seriola dumerili]XP_022593699.1 cell death regulator Aven [Seriola dumerili]
MESRPSRGRGGSWKRGGRGGHDSDSFGGEHRGRGRGGHHRGRGKRDHYRGRGRGGSAHATEFHNRHQDEGDNVQEEDDRREVFSRRKLESNWDRYAESEKQEPDDNMPTQRGTDYLVLLESAGDSFTQFRLAEEKDWEMDLFTASQMSAGFVDLPALAQTLQRVPLHQRLNLEAELVQVLTPVELPTVSPAPKQEMSKTSTFTPPSTTFKGLSINQKVPVATNPVSTSNASKLPEDDGDEELDQLLSLEKPVSGVVGNQSASVTDEERVSPEEVCAEMKEAAPEVLEEKTEEMKNKDVTPPKASVKQEMTEEDLEDWLDSMIS